MLCIGGHAVRRAQLEPGEPVLVIGAGPIGLSTIQFAQLAGANVTVMEVSDKRMEFGQRHLGVDQWVDGKGDPVPQLRALLGGDLPTTVFDATGNAQSMNNAFQLVDQGGKLIYVGLVQADITFHDPEFHRREMTLFASRNATAADFAYTIQMLDEEKIKLDPWITHRASPEELVTEFANWLDPEHGVVKAMLEF
jgi:threonine dehydrogenase-like Zn-dependent dehydrogenase